MASWFQSAVRVAIRIPTTCTTPLTRDGGVEQAYGVATGCGAWASDSDTGAGGGAGAQAGVAPAPAVGPSDSVKTKLTAILERLKAIEADVGITGAPTPSIAKFRAEDNMPTVPSGNLVHKHLTSDIYEKLYGLRTKSGWTVDRLIQCAMDYPVLDGHPLIFGALAGDAESYDTFAALLNPIIRDYHGFDVGAEGATHVTDLDPDHITTPNPDPEGKYILSSRVRAGRQVRGFAFTPNMSRAERREVLKLAQGACDGLPEDMAGTYLARNELMPAEHRELLARHLMFEDPDTWVILSGMARDWPDARGMFASGDGQTLVWVNEEDHLRLIAMQDGADVKAVFQRWSRLVKAFDDHLTAKGFGFAMHPRLGSLAPCPSNIGTGMRMSVHVRLPRTSALPGFEAFAHKNGVDVRGVGGERDKSRASGVVDLSNRSRIGKGEAQLVDGVLAFVTKCIALEKRLEGGEDGIDLAAHE